MFGFNKKQTNSTNGNSNLAGVLNNEKAKSDIILNAIGDGVVIIDDNKNIQLFNRGAENITGWKASDAIGLSYSQVIKLVNSKNEPYEGENNPFERVFIEKQIIRDNSASLLTQKGSTIAINLNVSPLFNADNTIVTGAVGVFMDVTNERQEEYQRAEFISTASHEMRTPVAAIEGYLSLAMNENVARIDSKAREYLEKAHTSTERLGKLFQDLLISAKAEDGRLQSHPEVIELGEYLQQLTEDVRFTAEKKGLGIEYVIGADDPQTSDATTPHKLVRPLYYAYIDGDRFREVMINLFDNAIKYTESGKITIGLTGNDQIVQIKIQDTGEGIPDTDIPHLFQKFYRVDNSATRTIGGTGLGLFICRKIIELYNGRIWVESTVGQGSTFYINLPRMSTQKAQQLSNKEALKTSS